MRSTAARRVWTRRFPAGVVKRRRTARRLTATRPTRPARSVAVNARALPAAAVTREREVVVVDVEDRPGVLADLTRKIARAGVDLDLVYVATRNRVVFGAPDLPALRAALGLAA